MFNKILRQLSQLNYILIIENGVCKFKNTETEKIALSFPSNEKIRVKEKILLDFYLELKEELELVDNQKRD